MSHVVVVMFSLYAQLLQKIRPLLGIGVAVMKRQVWGKAIFCRLSWDDHTVLFSILQMCIVLHVTTRTRKTGYSSSVSQTGHWGAGFLIQPPQDPPTCSAGR